MTIDPLALPWTPVAEGLGFSHIYWVRGSTKVGEDGRRNEVDDPPTSGWSVVYVLYDPDRPGLRLFHSATFRSYDVSDRSAEYATLRPAVHDHVDFAARVDEPAPMHASAVHWTRKTMRANWASFVRGTEPRDFETAARVLRMLGGPDMASRATAARRRDVAPAGKDAAPTLVKKVKRKGRKGEVLAFLVDAGLNGDLNALGEELGLDRKNALSQLYLLKKDHGIGYSISGDAVQVTLPEGVDDPFE